MSIFDYFNMSQGDLSMGGGQQQSLWSPDILNQQPWQMPSSQPGAPQMPMAPTPNSGGQSDVSGFANFGMQAPALPLPMAQMKVLNSIKSPQEPFLKHPQGGLMAYLNSLGV